MSIIAHNLSAMNTSRQWGITDRKKSAIAEKLGSGYQINRAADNAAGLSISEKMRGQIRGLEQASKNIQDGISYVQVADGALNEVHSILQRMRELAVQAANDTNVDADREAIDAEIQQLKEEVDSILEKTEFNTRPVWDIYAEEREVVDYEIRPAVTGVSMYAKSLTLNNQNKYLIAQGGYSINATEKGMQLSWKDYYGDMHYAPENDADGNAQYIPWPEPTGPERPDKPDEKSYLPQSFKTNFADYMSAEDKQIGLDLPLSFRITESATVGDLVASFDGTYFSQSTVTNYALELGNSISGVGIGGTNFNNYSILLALNSKDAEVGGNNIAGVDFTRRDDCFLEPSADQSGALPDFDAKTGNWSFVLESPSYPGVKFTVTSSPDITYYVSSREPQHEGDWWDYQEILDAEGNVVRRYKRTNVYQAAEGSTLASIDYALSNPSLNMVDHDAGHMGQMSFTFRIEADSPIYITKPDGSQINVGQNLGTFSMSVTTYGGDTAADVMERLKKINYMDIASGFQNPETNVQFRGEKYKTFNAPLWRVVNDFNVQAGANSEQGIHARYEALRTHTIGIYYTNVWTADDAGAAITEIDTAIEAVSAQRSYFGAMQNRMEHAHANADNTAENLQSSESRIRDADMAEGMVEYSKLTILEQASQSMLSHANQANQGILQLLQ